MKIKQSKKRLLGRFLVAAITKVWIIAAMVVLLSIGRVDGNDLSPNYKDGDLLIKSRFSDDVFFVSAS